MPEITYQEERLYSRRVFPRPGEAGTGGEVDHQSSGPSVVSALLLFKQGAAVEHSVKVYLNESREDVGSESLYLHAEIKAEHGGDPGIVD